MTCKEVLLNWLKNAYAMEKGMIETLEENIGDAEDDPNMSSAVEKMRQHIDETKIQAEKVKSAIESLDGDVSEIKTELTKAHQKTMSMALDLHKDHGVKNLILAHAAEHLEMASYMAIAKAAEMCQEEEIASMAREIMKQETQTGEKIEEEIENAVRSYFEKENIE